MKPAPTLQYRLGHYLPAAALCCAVGCGFVGIDLDGDQALLTDPVHMDNAGAAGTSSALPRGERLGRAGRGKVDGGSVHSGTVDSGTVDSGTVDSGVPDAGTADLDAGSVPAADSGAAAFDAGGTNTDHLDAGPRSVCNVGESCDLACASGSCALSCATGSSCRVTVGDAAQVTIVCAAGATCRASGASGSSVAFVCNGAGDCKAECGDASDCSILCQGTGVCNLDCQQAETCHLTCGGASACLLNGHDGALQFGVDCADQLPATICNELVLACNADCP